MVMVNEWLKVFGQHSSLYNQSAWASWEEEEGASPTWWREERGLVDMEELSAGTAQKLWVLSVSTLMAYKAGKSFAYMHSRQGAAAHTGRNHVKSLWSHLATFPSGMIYTGQI